MMFGTSLPILFPITFITLFMIYIIENYMLYYMYRLPPTYDERLNNTVLNILSWAPLFFLGFGFWQFSNF
jgi:hypothetical protein